MSRSSIPSACGAPANPWAVVRGAACCALLLLSACGSIPQRAEEPVEQRPPAVAAPTEPAAAAEPPTPEPIVSEPVAPLQFDPFQRFADGLVDIDCASSRLSEARPYTPAYLQRVFSNVGPMFGFVVEQLHARELPTQLALVALLESGLRADPGNRGAYRGMWQFSAATGRRFGLQIDASYDGRLSSIESTDAALKHLGDMWHRYGDWRWTVAGYNAGEQRMQKILQRHQRAGQIDNARVLAELPRHTRDYLKRLAAIACWIRAPGPSEAARQFAMDHALQRSEIASGSRSLEFAAAALGSDSSTLRALNPALAQARFPLRSAHPVLVPVSAAAQTIATASPTVASQSGATADEKPTAAAQQHVVASGDSLWTIARRYRVTVDALRRWNGLSNSTLIRPGQRLRVEP